MLALDKFLKGRKGKPCLISATPSDACNQKTVLRQFRPERAELFNRQSHFGENDAVDPTELARRLSIKGDYIAG